jgi:hypothetical protein
MCRRDHPRETVNANEETALERAPSLRIPREVRIDVYGTMGPLVGSDIRTFLNVGV